MNTAALAILGAGAGAVSGFAGGSLAPTRCLGRGEKAAVRGAIAGAAIGTVAGLVVRHVSRHERASRSSRLSVQRAETRDGPARAWSWRDVRPAVVALGGVAAAGAVIGGIQGGRARASCDANVGGAAALGSGVYGAGGLTAMAGSLLVVRFLF